MPTQGHTVRMWQRRDLASPPRPKAALGPKKQKERQKRTGLCSLAGPHHNPPSRVKAPHIPLKTNVLLLIFLSLCNGMIVPVTLLSIFSLRFPLCIQALVFQVSSTFTDAYKPHMAPQGKDKNRESQAWRDREKETKTGETLRTERNSWTWRDRWGQRQTEWMLMTRQRDQKMDRETWLPHLLPLCAPQ